MTNETIKRILVEKGVTHLYHVNSVLTACTFLENGGLLSRGAVEDMGLYQTPQETDQNDRDIDVFYDIFFDSVDIHQRSKQLNFYGPVMFVYTVDVIDSLPQDVIKITKDNPIRWNQAMTEDEKYFLSANELSVHYSAGDFTQHFTIRHQTMPLSFNCLEKIVIDDPEVDETKYFENACRHLQDLINITGLNIPLEVRQCSPECKCKRKYQSYKPGYIYHRFKIR